jgi:hypothetical protein
LLGERRATLGDLPGDDVGHRGPQRALHVEAVVAVEPGVLDGDHRLLHDLGDPVGGHRGAVLVVEPGDHLAVRGQHDGVARRGAVGQLDRQRV